MMRTWVRLILLLAVLAAMAFYIWHARAELQIITRIDLRFLLPMLAVPVLSLWVNGRLGKELIREFDVTLTPIEAYALSTVHALGNYLPVPQAGAVARGVYLKRVHNLSVSTYTASVIVTYFSCLAIYGLVGLAALGVLAATGRHAPWQLWLIFAALAGAVLMFTPLSTAIPLPRRLASFREGLARLRAHHVLAKIVLLQLAMTGLTGVGVYLACLSLPGGHQIHLFQGLMMGLLIMSSGVFNVTPGNLGVEQAAAMFTAHLLHIPEEIGFLASSLFRVMAVIVVFVIGPLFTHWLAKQPPRKRVSSGPTVSPDVQTAAP